MTILGLNLTSHPMNLVLKGVYLDQEVVLHDLELAVFAVSVGQKYFIFLVERFYSFFQVVTAFFVDLFQRQILSITDFIHFSYCVIALIFYVSEFVLQSRHFCECLAIIIHQLFVLFSQIVEFL